MVHNQLNYCSPLSMTLRQKFYIEGVIDTSPVYAKRCQQPHPPDTPFF